MSQSFTLKADGILRVLKTKVQICVGFDPKQPPNPEPKLMEFDAVWDTGATDSVVSQRVVDACGLKPIGMKEVHTAGGKCNCEVFLANIHLPNRVRFPNVHVTKADMGPTDMLIGMNIITRGDFALTHNDKKTCFSFRWPSSETIDFLKSGPDTVRQHQPRNDPCLCGSGKKYKHCCGRNV